MEPGPVIIGTANGVMEIAHVFLSSSFAPAGTQARLEHIITQQEEQDAAHNPQRGHPKIDGIDPLAKSSRIKKAVIPPLQTVFRRKVSRSEVIEMNTGIESKWIDKGQKRGEGQQPNSMEPMMDDVKEFFSEQGHFYGSHCGFHAFIAQRPPERGLLFVFICEHTKQNRY